MEIKKNERTEKNTVELTIAVDRETFQPAVERSFRKNQKSINIPGFRKGKAPRKMIEKLYGEAVFYDDAVNETYYEAYAAAVEESGIEPVAQPEVELLDVNADGYTFLAKVTVKPEVKLGQYKGLSAYKAKAEATDEQVDSELERLRDRVASTQKVDRPIQKDDTALIDYEGSVDGVPFEGGKGEKYPLVIGSGQFIPGFEDQLIGHKAGETVDVSVSFPEEYHAAELAGKAAVFKCLIHEVTETLRPELNDEFAKDISEFDSLDLLKADIRLNIQKNLENSEESMFEERLIDQILETMDAEIPQVMVERQIDQIMGQFSQNMAAQGVNLEEYFKSSGTDPESFRKVFTDQADKQVKTRLMFEEIAKLENVTVSDEEVEEEYKRLADQYEMPVEDVKKYITPDTVSYDLRIKRAVDIMKESATVLNEDPKKAPKAEAEAETDK